MNAPVATQLPWDACEVIGDSRDQASWHDARALGIGGSDSAAAANLSEYDDPLAVYYDKTLPRSGAGPNDYERWGHWLEPLVLRDYAEHRPEARLLGLGGLLLRSKKYPWMLCTIDEAQALPSPRASQAALVQVKTTSYGDRYDDEPPLGVLAQVQHEMVVTGAEWDTVVVFDFERRRVRWWDVAAHPAFQEFLVEELEKFHKRVVDRDPPDPDPRFWKRKTKIEHDDQTQAALRGLRRLYPMDDGSTVQLGTEWIRKARRYVKITSAISRLERYADEIKLELAQALGPATYGEMPDGSHWSLKAHTRKLYTCEECQHVERSAPYRTPLFSEGKMAKARRMAGGAA